MAELEIGPENIGVGGRVPSLPTTPIYSEIEKTSKDIESRALILLAHIKKQEQDTTNTNALIYYKSHLNQLDQNVAGIKDYDKRISIYKSGLNDLSDQVKKEFPKISDSAFKTIQLQMSNDFREHTLKVIADKTEEGKRDFPIALHDLALATAQAKSPQEQHQLELHTHDYINNSLNNGFIDATRAKYEIAHFHEQVQEQHYNELLATHPEQVLAIPFEKSGLTSQKYNQFINAANSKLNNEENAAFRNFHHEKAKYLEEALDDPSKATLLYNQRKLSKADAEFISGHKIIEGDDVLSDHFSGEFETANTPEELTDMYVDALKHGITGANKTILTTRYHEKLGELKTEHGQMATDLFHDIYNHLEDSDSTWNMPAMDKFTENYKFNKRYIRGSLNQLKETKNAKEMHELHDKIIKEIDNHYKSSKVELIAPETKPTEGETNPNE